jgi:hypothetical protein
MIKIADAKQNKDRLEQMLVLTAKADEIIWNYVNLLASG